MNLKLSEEGEQRFWSKVDKTKDCWEWKACVNEAGYGIFGVPNMYRNDRAHRISYRLHFGKIPKGKFVCHKCDNRRCVNPSHLFIGSNMDNVNDMIRKGRNSKPPPMGGWNKYSYSDEILALFGKMADTDIARMVGVSKHAICRERKRRGIPAFPCQTRFKSGQPHPCWSRKRKEVNLEPSQIH